MTENKAFEATYREYPFPVLIDFGLALSRLFVRVRARRAAARALPTAAVVRRGAAGQSGLASPRPSSAI